MPSERRKQIAAVIFCAFGTLKVNVFDTRTLCVPKKMKEKNVHEAEKSKFIASAARNMFALQRVEICSNKKVIAVQTKMESNVPSKTFPVSVVNAKQQNAPRLMAPSRKQAIRPAYSLASAPMVTRSNGAAVNKICRIVFIVWPRNLFVLLYVPSFLFLKW